LIFSTDNVQCSPPHQRFVRIEHGHHITVVIEDGHLALFISADVVVESTGMNPL
jgi:hypothetical protein